MLFRCYRNGDDPFTADGWYPTGDSGSLDSSGVLTVFGRMGEMIITGGENVWPVAVERILESDFCLSVPLWDVRTRVGKRYRDRGAGEERLLGDAS